MSYLSFWVRDPLRQGGELLPIVTYGLFLGLSFSPGEILPSLLRVITIKQANATENARFCPYVQVSCPSWWVMYSHILLYGHIENNFCVLYKTQDEEIHYIFKVSAWGLCVILQLYFSTGERLCLIRIYVSLFAKAARELQAKFSFQMCSLLHCRHLTKQYSPIKNFRASLFFKVFFLMGISFKVFIEFVTILLLFHVFGFLATRYVGS